MGSRIVFERCALEAIIVRVSTTPGLAAKTPLEVHLIVHAALDLCEASAWR